ncbi:MAG: DinB family protein, partial [Acidimicrobiia bacterium]
VEALEANAAGLAATLSGVSEKEWQRTGRRTGDVFTVLGAGRFALHEGHHHLLDMGRVLRAARGR